LKQEYREKSETFTTNDFFFLQFKETARNNEGSTRNTNVELAKRKLCYIRAFITSFFFKLFY